MCLTNLWLLVSYVQDSLNRCSCLRPSLCANFLQKLVKHYCHRRRFFVFERLRESPLSGKRQHRIEKLRDFLSVPAGCR